jgi:hypothetical protein
MRHFDSAFNRQRLDDYITGKNDPSNPANQPDDKELIEEELSKVEKVKKLKEDKEEDLKQEEDPSPLINKLTQHWRP